jgi:hypothetical protein
MRISAFMVLALAACGNTGDPATPNAPPAPPVTPSPDAGTEAPPPPPRVGFVLQVLDAKTSQGVPRTLLTIQTTNEKLGAITSADGFLGLTLEPGSTHATVRTYGGGYASSVTDLDLTKPSKVDANGGWRWIVDESPLDATEAPKQPKATGFTASKVEVQAGDPLRFDATVAAGDASDPLAEVLVIEPNHFVPTPLDGTGDGPYGKDAAAPAEAGTYTWYLVARTKGDAVGDAQAVTATVRSKALLVPFSGKVVDDATSQPLASAVVTLEVGDVYVDFSDRSRPSPYYMYGGITASDGTFTVMVPNERIGIHTFTTGYLYAGKVAITDPSAPGTLVKSKAIPAQQATYKPVVTAFTATPSTVAAGTPFELSANVVKGTVGTDPLSDEILLVQPDTGFCGEMTPPAPGARDDYPDGRWARTVFAPAKAGTYTYWLVTTSAGCVTSDNQSLTVTVQ